MRTPGRWLVALLALSVTASLPEAARSIADSRKPQAVLKEGAYLSTQGEWGARTMEKHRSFVVYLSYGSRSLSVDCSSRRCVIEFEG